MTEHSRETTNHSGTFEPVSVKVQPASMVATAQIASPSVVVRPRTYTSMGYDIAETFVVHKSEAVDGVVQYELLVDGESHVWAGPEDEQEDAVLDIALKIVGQEPDIPNN